MGTTSSAPVGDSLEGRDVRQLDKRVSSALAKGVRYNMKILIRGERKTGKTQLLRLLQGIPFEAAYTATPEITTAHVIWTCPTTEENVKVELWDVVDVGIQPKTEWAGVMGGDAANSHDQAGGGGAASADVVLLDAATINVYQGCDGVLICYDPTRRESYDYAVSLVKALPRDDIPVLLAANFADVCAGDASKSKVKQSELDKLARSRKLLSCVQMCCKVSFGVDEVRAFLSVPLLCLQQRYAEKQIHQAQQQLDETRERLDSHADTLNYAAHCAQWQAGGAAQARAQADRIAKVKADGADKAGADPLSPSTGKKMVPLEKLMLPARVDKNAPDLGQEVESFNTGMIDEGFFSSDDDMGHEVEVMDSASDEENAPKTAITKDEEGVAHQPSPSGKGGESDSSAHSSSDDGGSEDEAAARRGEQDKATQREEERVEAEAIRVAKALREEKERAKEAEEAKKRAEEALLAQQIQEVPTGSLEAGFLTDDEDDDDAAKPGARSGSDSSSDGGGKGGIPADSDSDSGGGGRPDMMGDEDIDSD